MLCSVCYSSSSEPSSPSVGSNLPLYSGVGQVQDSWGVCVYGPYALESMEALSRRLVDKEDVVAPKKLWASSSCLALTPACQVLPAWTGFPQVHLLESSQWRERPGQGADEWA
jgi:hypothetical protein